MIQSGRELARRALALMRTRGAWPDKLFLGLDSENMDPRDLALAYNIVLGVTQNMALCDFYITQFSSIGIKKLQPQVLDILRLSVYQIVFLSKIPAIAAVNEGVALTKKHVNQRASGFVNAVLRKLTVATSNGNLPPVPNNSAPEYLSVLYSHPLWFVNALISEYGVGETECILRSNNVSNLPLSIQLNSLKTDMAGLLGALSDDGIEYELSSLVKSGVRLKNAGRPDKLKAFVQGYFYVQDDAARLSVEVGAMKPGYTVIDGCAAPGGKSFSATIDMNNDGHVWSCDIGKNKLRFIEEGRKRLGLSVIRTRVMDAAKLDDSYQDTADVVIADVPCSGLGVIRKKPDIRYKSESELYEIPDRQLMILENLSKYVKPGGILIYSTCTILSRENECVIDRFLSRRAGFKPENFNIPGFGSADNGMCTLLPHKHNTDGFFICKLRKDS